MRDYYAVIARAVSQLDNNTPAAHNAIFNRAHAILIDHLRTRQPPASNSEIMRECAALEDAVRKIQLEMAMAKKGPRPLQTPPLRLNYTNGGPPTSRENSANDRLKDQNGSRSGDRTKYIKTIKAPNSVKSHHAIRGAKGSIQALRGFFKRHRGMLAGRRTKNAKTRVRSTAAERPGAGAAGLHQTTILRNETKRGLITVRDRHDSGNDAVANVDIPIFNHLLGIRWLDQLMLDAADPTAPDSLRADAQTVLEWLGVDKAAALDIEHYHQFTRAFQRYITECQNPLLEPINVTQDFSLVLTDDIRGMFSRLLEREQTARIFDRTLMWLAKVWIRMVLILNVIIVIWLVGAAPNLWIGVVRLYQAYSPANLSNWAAQIVALSPALTAIIWLHGRLKNPRIVAIIGFAKSITRSSIWTVVNSSPHKDPRDRESGVSQRRALH
jgi:hypothetical protein